MPNLQIILPTRLTASHLRVVLKYFEGTNRLSPPEWMWALESFDLLAQATLVTGRRSRSFRQFYEREVERRYADEFLTALLVSHDPETEGDDLQQQVAAEILANLEQDGLYHEDVNGSEYLAAYCLYWWTSFARGYRFEVTILGELQIAGIEFTTHDLRVRAQRLSPYDLVVNRLGDIKHTTYFLYAARTLPLKCDFYITRLYHARGRRYQRVVILTEEVWHDLNGAVAVAPLEFAADLFPAPVQIDFEGRNWVVVTFELWLGGVKRIQQQER